jgi:hypothetical protein
MKLIIILFVATLGASNVFAAKRTAKVNTVDLSYTVQYEKNKFSLVSSLLHRDFDVKDCNRSAFDRTWRQIIQNSKSMGSKKKINKHNVIVAVNGGTKFLPVNSEGGRYFQSLPGKMLILGIESDRLCKAEK